MPNFDQMTAEQKKQWEFNQELDKMCKEEALENKEDFNETITCAVCDTMLGYSKERWVEALCEGCKQ